MRVNSKTLKGWLKYNFTKSELGDIASHGCACGFAGLTYYTQTCYLYDKFEYEIWEKLQDEAEAEGTTPIQYMGYFNGVNNIASPQTFKNALVWWYCETIARELTPEVVY